MNMVDNFLAGLDVLTQIVPLWVLIAIVVLGLLVLYGLIYLTAYIAGQRYFEFERRAGKVRLTITYYFMGLFPVRKNVYEELRSVETTDVTVNSISDTIRDKKPTGADPTTYRRMTHAVLRSGKKVNLKGMVFSFDANSSINEDNVASQVEDLIAGKRSRAVVIKSSRIVSVIASIILFFVGFEVLKFVLVLVIIALAFLFDNGQNEDVDVPSQTQIQTSNQTVSQTKNDSILVDTVDTNDSSVNPNGERNTPVMDDNGISNDIVSNDIVSSDSDSENASDVAPIHGGDYWEAIDDDTLTDDSVQDSHNASPIVPSEKTIADLPDYIPQIDHVTYDDIRLDTANEQWIINITSRDYDGQALAQVLKAGFADKGWQTSKIYEAPVHDINGEAKPNAISYMVEFRTYDKSVTGGSASTMPARDGRGVDALIFVPIKE